MSKKIFLFIICVTFSYVSWAQGGKTKTKTQNVKLEIVSPSKTDSPEKTESKVYTIAWPFSQGPLPVGGRTEVLNKINAILADNKIDCPPKRSQIGDNIWLCGNGKKIKTDDPKLKDLLTAAWKENE